MPGFLENAVKLLELINDFFGMARWFVWRPVVIAKLDQPDLNGNFCIEVSKMHRWGKAVVYRVFIDKVTNGQERRRSEIGSPVELWPGPVRLFGRQASTAMIFSVFTDTKGWSPIRVTTALGIDMDSGNMVMGQMYLGDYGQQQELHLTVRILFCLADDPNLTELTDKILRIAVKPAPLAKEKYEWALLPREEEHGKTARSVQRLMDTLEGFAKPG